MATARSTHGRPEATPAAITAQAKAIIGRASRCSRWAATTTSRWPLLRAHARVLRPAGARSVRRPSGHLARRSRAGPTPRIDHGTMSLPRRPRRPGRSRALDPDRHAHPHRRGPRLHRARRRAGARPRRRRDDRGIERWSATASAYLTFDIDCLDPAFAPGTGTPVCGGLSSRRPRRSCAGCATSISSPCDVVEVAPPYDVSRDHRARRRPPDGGLSVPARAPQGIGRRGPRAPSAHCAPPAFDRPRRMRDSCPRSSRRMFS